MQTTKAVNELSKILVFRNQYGLTMQRERKDILIVNTWIQLNHGLDRVTRIPKPCDDSKVDTFIGKEPRHGVDGLFE
jgi:hypothetical protein